jgi:hypothetical protein
MKLDEILLLQRRKSHVVILKAARTESRFYKTAVQAAVVELGRILLNKRPDCNSATYQKKVKVIFSNFGNKKDTARMQNSWTRQRMETHCNFGSHLLYLKETIC